MSNIDFKNIVAHTHQGKRAYQEDSYAYGDNFVLVSDGVGGLAKGDIASKIVVQLWQKTIKERMIKFEDLEQDIEILVEKTVKNLNSYTQLNPDSEGMGATVACVVCIQGKVIAIHIGDSRIYHFNREGQIKWKSKDHSFVRELIDAGVITEKEATNHPRRNVITRVLQAKRKSDSNASVYVFENVSDGDIILVCTDGIIESWTDENLSNLIKNSLEPKEIISKIGEYSIENSNDNNTAIIAQVASVASM